MALKLKHQTIEQFVARVRAAYRDSDGERTVQIAKFIVASNSAGDITDAQYRSAWGINQGAWASLKGRMTALIASSNSVKSAVGE